MAFLLNIFFIDNYSFYCFSYFIFPIPRYFRHLDGELVYRIEAKALNITGAIIPEEPM